LKRLDCFENQFTVFPKFNRDLFYLDCSSNRLVELPRLNSQLQELYCYNNELRYLPVFNLVLKVIVFDKNPIYDILVCVGNSVHHHRHFYDSGADIHFDSFHEFINYMNTTHGCIVELREKNQIFHNFRELFYSLKYKKTFRYLLWDKVRRPKIEAKYHPDNLQKLLNGLTNNDEWMDVLEKW
jgi:Leucine-rich repeat (LRR) protein